MRKHTDPVAPWFLAAEAVGEFIGMRFGRVAPGANEPEWIFIRHAECDGIGAISEIFRKRGATFDSLPQAKHPAAPSLSSFFKLLGMYLQPRRRLKWKHLGPSEKRRCYPTPPPAVAWHAWDEATTSHIRGFCSKGKVTVNSFLLKQLTQTILPHLEEPSPVVPWMIPVNLRGRVACECDTANHTSYLGVKVRPADSIQDIHQNIHAAMERGEHCTNWFAFELGRFTTHGMRKFLFRHELATTRWNLGAFSNLGVWDPKKKITHPACLGTWLVCPPVLRFQLIGAGCITFQNKLGMTLQIHPELTADPAIARSWMDHWVRHIETALLAGLPHAAAVADKASA